MQASTDTASVCLALYYSWKPVIFNVTVSDRE